MKCELTRFQGLGSSLAQIDGMNRWGDWVTSPRELSLIPDGKRIQNIPNTSVLYNTMIDTKARTIPFVGDIPMSCAYPVEWLTPTLDTATIQVDMVEDISLREALAEMDDITLE